MAKLPRLPYNERPSGVPRGSNGAPGAAETLRGVADLAGGLAQGAAQVQMDEAHQQRYAMEKKQAIVDEVEAARVSGELEEQLVGYEQNLQKENWDNPQEAPKRLRDVAEGFADQFIKYGSTSDAQMKIAQRSRALIETSVHRLGNWVIKRQTQKAEGDLDKRVNSIENIAAGLDSTDALSAHLEKARADLGPAFEGVYGADAPHKLNEMDRRATYAFVDATATTNRNPLGALALLDMKQGPIFENLPADDRRQLRAKARESYEGFEKSGQFNLAVDGMRENQDVEAAWRAGDPNVGGMVYKKRIALERLKEVLAVTPTLREEGRKAQIDIVDRRLRTLGSLDTAIRRQSGYDGPDDENTRAALWRAHDKIVTGRGDNTALVEGVTMFEVAKHQEKLAEALAAGKIKQSTYDNFFKSLALVTGDAATNEQKQTGGYWRGPQDARQFGNQALNSALDSTDFRGIPDEKKIDARMKFMQLYVEASNNGRQPSNDEGRRLALLALSLVTGKSVPGAWKK